MNPKITKLRTELEKNNSKIASLQARNRDIEKQIRELENTDIIGMVRENGMTIEQFAELFQMMKDNVVTPPAPAEVPDEA